MIGVDPFKSSCVVGVSVCTRVCCCKKSVAARNRSLFELNGGVFRIHRQASNQRRPSCLVRLHCSNQPVSTGPLDVKIFSRVEILKKQEMDKLRWNSKLDTNAQLERIFILHWTEGDLVCF